MSGGGDSGGVVSDRELWDRAAAGERAGLGAVFERHADAVYTHGLLLAGSQVAAAELTQTVFLAAWRDHERVWLVDDSILPWLLGLAESAAPPRSPADAARAGQAPTGLATLPLAARRATRRALEDALWPSVATTRRWKSRTLLAACVGVAVALASVAALVLALLPVY
jgi:RNA polymerase sigma-70 factor (ECF subfamily)